MVRVEVTHVFGVEVSEAFSCITDIANWPEYWPGFVRLEDQEGARWSEPGDRLTVVLDVLGQERSMHMELDQFQVNSLVTYRTRQDGLPDARHERHFKAAPGGFEYTMVIAFEPRRGCRGLYDRLVIPLGVKRAMRKTIGNLERLLAAHL